MPEVEVILSPLLAYQIDFKDKDVVVIDILRATTTINAALQAGAKGVITVESVEEAARYIGREGYVAAAERDGMIVPGFEWGNSPLALLGKNLTDKTYVLTSTNGTRCIYIADGANRLLSGAFSNLAITVRYLQARQKNIVLFCAGWKNNVSYEDTLYAGAVIAGLPDYSLHQDAALMALETYLLNKDNLPNCIIKANHYHRLAQKGLKEDIMYCMHTDTIDFIACWDRNKFVKKQLVSELKSL